MIRSDRTTPTAHDKDHDSNGGGIWVCVNTTLGLNYIGCYNDGSAAEMTSGPAYMHA